MEGVVRWPDDVDEIVAGDLTTALAYLTPAGGVVITAVAPIGLRDRERGEVTFTTSLGFGRKLERIRSRPQVALLYHAREHGFHEGSELVLVHGTARISERPDRTYLDEVVGPAAESYMGPPRRGVFWDRWLREYYSDRVPVHVDVERAARRARPLRHALLGWCGADGYPSVVPVELGDPGSRGIPLTSARPLPPGGRRAGLLAHDYGPHLVGLRVRQFTGWLEGGVYAPHTEQGFRAPSNKTLLLLANGFMAKRGLRKARKTAVSAA